MEDRPEDQRRTIADIVGWIANFTHKIKWVFTKDLKPRVLFGLKSDGTVVHISDTDGFPQFTNKKPEIVAPQEAYTWAGTPGDADGTPWISKGHRYLILLCTQAWTTDPTSITVQLHSYKEGSGTVYVDESNVCDQAFTVIANLRNSFMILRVAGTNEYFPVGEMAYQQRLRITTVGVGTAGVLNVTVYGVR